MPRIGCVQYLNAHPLIRGWEGEVVFDHPSVLCRSLASGNLEVALVSSFEFLRNPVYRIVDQVAIASDGPVYSVVVAMEPGAEPREIEVDPASATAISLLRILMAERSRDFASLPMPADNLSPLSGKRARFLIGDQAIRFREKFGDRYEYLDEGAEWTSLTSLPFVFALWLIRPEVSDARFIADRLRRIRDDNISRLNDLIGAEKQFDHAFCRTYYREHLRFSFNEREKQGLAMFERLCVKHGLLPDRERPLALV